MQDIQVNPKVLLPPPPPPLPKPPLTTTKHKMGGKLKVKIKRVRREFEASITAITNEITSAYFKEKDASRKNQKIAKHKLDEIIETFKAKRRLPDVHINKSTIRTRVLRNKTLVFQPAGGKLSPMFDVEPKHFAIIVNMSKIRESISPTQSLRLANSLIEVKPIEK